MTKIPWTQETWNPVVGCTKCSPGCLNCYAEKMAGRLANMGQGKYMGVVTDRWTSEGVVFNSEWNNKIRCDESALDKPLHWRDPRKIFVCSMSDLFHKDVPFEFAGKVFATAIAADWHTLQFLTKRVGRMLEFCQWFNERTSLNVASFKHLHLGVSISTHKEADEKIPILLQIPAAVRFLSIEPLLEGAMIIPLKGIRNNSKTGLIEEENINQVIIGAESKGSHPGRRCELDWVKNIIDQCDAAGVPVFVKQLHINGKLIKDPKQWPSEFRRQDYPK